MKITIIVPTFNRSETLSIALASALSQGDAETVDVLVIDDGSTDDTPALLSNLQSKHVNLRVVRTANGGVTEARNYGLSHLLPESQFVTFLDSDDVLPKNRLVTDLARFKGDPSLELTYGQMELTDALDPVTMTPPPTARVARVTGIHLSCCLFRRSLIERIGRFDLDFVQAEDTDYILRVFETDTRFVQTDTLCLYYRRHPGNMTARLDETRRFFALALLKSMRRRKADPTRRLVKPDFEVEILRELGSF
jgi:glycosyltransferase involved in cell wall biosynthesis